MQFGGDSNSTLITKHYIAPRRGRAASAMNSAPPIASPESIKAFIHGRLGAAAYLLSSTQGGARKADEVAVHISTSVSDAVAPAPPSSAACGISHV